MSHPQIIIPFALPPAEHAKDLVKMLASEGAADGLALLLARNSSLLRTRQDDFSLALPHEVWLSNQQTQHQQLSPLQQQALRLGVQLQTGYWFMVNPVHLHIASNHLVLTDQRQLALSELHATALFEKAQQLCAEVDIELVYGNSSSWFLRANSWSDFITSTPDAACGHNIEIWSVKGQQALAWRKLQNEIQMEWFIHPLQQQREQQGLTTINGVWLWAGSQMVDEFPQPTPQPAPLINATDVETFIQSPGLIVLDQLSSAALASDWGTWAAQLIELDHDWIAPVCRSLKNRQLNQCQLLLSNTTSLVNINATALALHKFWRAPTFKLLA